MQERSEQERPEHQRSDRHAIDYARLAWGAALVWRPDEAVRAAGHPATTTSTTIARILGARHIVQSLLLIVAKRVLWLRPRPIQRRIRKLAAGADALHALSAGALALGGEAPRTWTVDAAAASAFAAATWRSAEPTRSEQIA